MHRDQWSLFAMPADQSSARQMQQTKVAHVSVGALVPPRSPTPKHECLEKCGNKINDLLRQLRALALGFKDYRT
jgi:hypothetical protein